MESTKRRLYIDCRSACTTRIQDHTSCDDIAPTTRGGTKPSKTVEKSADRKKRPVKTIREATKKALEEPRTMATAPRIKKTLRKDKTISSAQGTSGSGAIGSPPVSYCEEDRRLHGTYKRCGRGALFMAHKTSPNRASAADAAAMPCAMSKTYSPARVSKDSKARKSDLDYNAVVRNGARLVLRGLEDVFKKISTEPMASETALKGVREHVGGAMDQLQSFLDAGREYSNPHPKVNFRKEFEEGDGIGNWISFKPAWFEQGRFGLGDILTFQSTLQGLKAEGEVVTLHR